MALATTTGGRPAAAKAVAAEHGPAGLARQVDVEQDEVRARACRPSDACAASAVRGHGHVVAVGPQVRRQEAGEGLVVLDEQERGRRRVMPTSARRTRTSLVVSSDPHSGSRTTPRSAADRPDDVDDGVRQPEPDDHRRRRTAGRHEVRRRS